MTEDVREPKLCLGLFLGDGAVLLRNVAEFCGFLENWPGTKRVTLLGNWLMVEITKTTPEATP